MPVFDLSEIDLKQQIFQGEDWTFDLPKITEPEGGEDKFKYKINFGAAKVFMDYDEEAQ